VTMKRLLAACVFPVLAGCASSNLPVITPDMTSQDDKGSSSVAQLERGRILFASRCIECHTLPPLMGHTESQWPHLVKAMANRANLKPGEREAVTAYILAARTQKAGSD
jgi:mono/diheme cytochrome c family protein